MALNTINLRYLTSIYFDQRPKDVNIDTIVMHSMFNPTRSNNNDAKFDILSCFNLLNSHQVSAHYLISTDGLVYETVNPKYRAWHAGISKMPFSNDKREKVNDFSIGIELIGDSYNDFSKEQYSSLNDLLAIICSNYAINAIVSHKAIAPGRKTDPESHFDWKSLKNFLPNKIKYAF